MKYVKCIVFYTFLFVITFLNTYSTSTIWFGIVPHVDYSPSNIEDPSSSYWQTIVTIHNVSDIDNDVVFYGYNQMGALIRQSETFTLNPHATKDWNINMLFPAFTLEGYSNLAFLIVESTAQIVLKERFKARGIMAGLDLEVKNGETFEDVKSLLFNHVEYLPHLDSSWLWFTGVASVTDTPGNSFNLTVNEYNEDTEQNIQETKTGQFVEDDSIVSKKAFLMETFMESESGDWGEFQNSNTARSVGYELFGILSSEDSEGVLSGMNNLKEATFSNEFYLPVSRFVDWTGISFTNPNSFDIQFSIDFVMEGESKHSIIKTLHPMQRVTSVVGGSGEGLDLSGLFEGLNIESNQPTGFVKITVNDDSISKEGFKGLGVALVQGDNAFTHIEGVSGSPIPSNSHSMIVPFISSHQFTHDGINSVNHSGSTIHISNIGNASGHFGLKLYDMDGNVFQEYVYPLSAGDSFESNIQDLPGNPQFSGSILVNGNIDMTGYYVIYSQDDQGKLQSAMHQMEYLDYGGLSFGLYDDFDGKGSTQNIKGYDLAKDRELAYNLWSPKSSASIEQLNVTHDNVLKIRLEEGNNFTSIDLNNPYFLQSIESEKFGADLMIPSISTAVHYSVAASIGTYIPELAKYWETGISLYKDDYQNVWINGYVHNLVSEEYINFPASIQGTLDTWYHLEIHVDKNNENQLVFKYYVDGNLQLEVIPEQDTILQDINRLDNGFGRRFSIYNEDKQGTPLAYIDNVDASYQNETIGFQVLYDDFDGSGGHQYNTDSELAVDGTFSKYLWAYSGEIVDGSVYNIDTETHNNVMEVKLEDNLWKDIELNNPFKMNINSMDSLSTDVLIPDSPVSEGYFMELKYDVSLNIPDFEYFRSSIGIRKDENGFISIYASGDGKGEDDFYRWMIGKSNTWYTLRQEYSIVNGILKVDYYVNDIFFYTHLFENSTAIFDSTKITYGPRRVLGFSNTGNGQTHFYIDNIRANYNQQFLNNYPMYDDFDGHGCEQPDGTQRAEDGILSSNIWRPSSGDVTVIPCPSHLPEAPIHNNVLQIRNEGQFVPPAYVSWRQLETLSFDILVSSESTCEKGHFWVELHSWIPEIPPGKSAVMSYNVSYNNGMVESGVSYRNYNSSEERYQKGKNFSLDVWHEIRFDIHVVNDEYFEVLCYVDGFYEQNFIPELSGLILNPSPILDFYQNAAQAPRLMNLDSEGGNLIYYLDNIRMYYPGVSDEND